MAASLPISAALDSTASRPAASAAVSGLAAPSSIRLPLAFILTGLIALMAGLGLLLARPSILATYHYNQYVIATTHLFVLGWICSVVMGAMYQLVPVALETKLHSEKLAWAQFALHAVGFAGMVWMFWTWNMKEVGHFGSVFAAGVALFVYNIGRTLWRVPRWNVTATAVTAALFWLSLTVFAGLCVAAAKCSYETPLDSTPAGATEALVFGLQSVAVFMARFDSFGVMHAHAHLGGIGCFTMLLVGVSYKLIPMFTLSEVQNRRRAAWSVALLNIGLAGSFITILLRSSWKLEFSFVIILALIIYARELVSILQARKRRALDWGIKSFLTAVALLAPLSVLAVVLSLPGLPLTPFTGQLENVYGFLGFIGVITLAIIGILYKIIPFLVWFGSYSRQIGRAKVPALSDLYSARLQAGGYWLFLGGLAVTCAGVLAASETGVRWGCGLLALSVATLILNVVRMLEHFFKPQFQPLVRQPAAA